MLLVPSSTTSVRREAHERQLAIRVAFISLFIMWDDLPIDRPNGEGWLLRAYRTVDGLVPFQEPADRGSIKPFPVRWTLIEED